jgi:ubiquinone/menaquinone biosynthesis C-methylase UbiE
VSVLDVGCGLHPRGDVNTDAYLDSTHRRRGVGPSLDPSSIQRFVKAEAENMPMFRDRQFTVVRCHQVLEHIQNWRQALREMWRVCDHHLIIEVPDRRWLPFPKLHRSPVHISNFDKQTLTKAIPLILGTRNFEVTTRYRGMFHKMLPFPLFPHIVRVDVYRD